MRGGIVLALLLLAGCGRSADDRQPGDVSPAEQQSLNDAAAMLDANSMDANTVTGNAADD